MEYETYREMMNDMALKVEELKSDRKELLEIINNAIEYIEAYPIDTDVFLKRTGRYETPFKDLEKILGGIKGIEKTLEVKGWSEEINKAYDLLKETPDETITITSLLGIIELENNEIENLRNELEEERLWVENNFYTNWRG